LWDMRHSRSLNIYIYYNDKSVKPNCLCRTNGLLFFYSRKYRDTIVISRFTWLISTASSFLSRLHDFCRAGFHQIIRPVGAGCEEASSILLRTAKQRIVLAPGGSWSSIFPSSTGSHACAGRFVASDRFIIIIVVV
jgi:hypothetical protein